MSMEQFLDNLSLNTLEELKKNAQQIQENVDSNKLLDGEEEVDKLLMMHMSKHR